MLTEVRNSWTKFPNLTFSVFYNAMTLLALPSQETSRADKSWITNENQEECNLKTHVLSTFICNIIKKGTKVFFWKTGVSFVACLCWRKKQIAVKKEIVLPHSLMKMVQFLLYSAVLSDCKFWSNWEDAIARM